MTFNLFVAIARILKYDLESSSFSPIVYVSKDQIRKDTWMRVFVTGGAGFIGSAVVRELVRNGWHATCLVRPTTRTNRIDDLAVDRLIGDVRDAAALQIGMRNCDATIHLAGLSSWNDINSGAMEQVVVSGTRNVLDCAAELSGHKVVFVSSITAVNGSDTPQVFDEDSAFTLTDPALRYAHAKRAAEALCWEAFGRGVPVVIVNPAEVYGPNDQGMITAGNLVDFSRSTPVLVCSGGTSVAHVDDVAAGIVAALDRGRPGERYILGGENVTILELARHCLEILDRRVRVLKMPNAMLRTITRLAGVAHIPLPYNPQVVPYATRYWFMNAEKAQRELGVSFRDARDTLISALGWLQEAGYLT
jgi:dihydroflavonol-4-reductase